MEEEDEEADDGQSKSPKNNKTHLKRSVWCRRRRRRRCRLQLFVCSDSPLPSTRKQSRHQTAGKEPCWPVRRVRRAVKWEPAARCGDGSGGSCRRARKLTESIHIVASPPTPSDSIDTRASYIHTHSHSHEYPLRIHIRIQRVHLPELSPHICPIIFLHCTLPNTVQPNQVQTPGTHFPLPPSPPLYEMQLPEPHVPLA